MELKYKYFGKYGDLCDFVNENNIQHENIQQITETEDFVTLFYWG